MEKTYENILSALKYYVPRKYWVLNNWNIIIGREKEIEENVFEYKCSFMTLYFNEKLEPLEYNHQHIIGDDVYYFNKNDFVNRSEIVLGKVDWYNQNDWGN